MDLSTTYLGLTLRTPLVPSASPLSEEIDNIKRMEDAGASAVVLYSLFEEQIVQERFELHDHLTQGTESFAEALTYFPRAAAVPSRPRGIPEPHPQGQGGGRHPGHCQLERHLDRRLDQLRAADAAGGRRRVGAERLLHPDRHGAERRRDRADVRRHPHRGEVGGHDAGGAEARAVLQQHGAHGPASRPGRRQRVGAVQPLLSAGHRPRSARNPPARAAEHAAGVAPAAHAGSASSTAASAPTWPPPAASTTPATC